MTNKKESFCSFCGWSGDAMGLVDCPTCNQPLPNLEEFDEDAVDASEEKYPEEYLEEDQDANKGSDDFDGNLE